MTTEFYGDQNFDWTQVVMCGMASKYTPIMSPEEIKNELSVELCVPPVSGDWIINTSCTIESDLTVLSNVIVQNNAVLTIPSGLTLDIDFVNNFLKIEFGSGIKIKAGGTLT